MSAHRPHYRRTVFVIVGICLTLFGKQNLLCSADLAVPQSIVYLDPARTVKTVVTDRSWTQGPILDGPQAAEEMARQGLLPEQLSRPIADCSDEKFRCIRAWSRVLAVPVSGLSRNLVYKKNGVLFSVEECIRGAGNSCRVALLSAKCKYRETDESDCRLMTEAKRGEVFEYIVYFLYNEGYGITAMGVTDREQAFRLQKMAVATQLVLASDAGLLKLR